MRHGALSLALIVLFAACSSGGGSDGGQTPSPPSPPPPSPPPPGSDIPNLYALAPPDVAIGVAVPAGDAPNNFLASVERRDIVDNHFNQLTAENIMKPSYVHPAENTFFFDDADALVDYAATQGKTVHGHVLIWHNQLPSWMNTFAPGDATTWTSMMRDHITRIVSHFASGNTIVSWDVVNEAFTDSDTDGDGLYDLRSTPWMDNIGPGYLADAFRAAAAADADADLYYNDYNIAGVTAKLDAVLDLVDQFRSDPSPVPIDGIGFQMHVSLDWPDISQIGSAFSRAAATGLKVKITELDVTVNTNGDGTPGPMTSLTVQVAAQQQQRIQDIVTAYLAEVPAAQRGGISVWGIADRDSWRRYNNDFEWPLLFDDSFQPKPALQGFADGLTSQF